MFQICWPGATHNNCMLNETAVTRHFHEGEMIYHGKNILSKFFAASGDSFQLKNYYWWIVPFHKSQDTLLHPGLNDQIQNTLFTEDPHVTRALWGWFDWLPGSACADLNWSALVNHIGFHPLPATQPTLIGHALYIKPCPSQFSVPHVPPCMHGNGEIFVCNI